MSASGRLCCKTILPVPACRIDGIDLCLLASKLIGPRHISQALASPIPGKNNRRADGKIVGEPLDSRVLRHPFAKPPPAVSRHALIWVPSRMGGLETAGAGNGHGSRN